MSLFYKRWFFLLVAVLVLGANFYAHLFSTLPVTRFLNNEFPSEGFVISRMVYSETEGLSGSGGFMVRYPFINDLFMAPDKEAYKDFTRRGLDNNDQASIYLSHLGFQDNFLYPLWQGLRALRDHVKETSREGSRWQKRMMHYDAYYMVMVSQLCVALFNALVLGLILLWVFRQFSPPAAWVTLGLMLVMMPDLTFFGRSMWWMMGVWFLPFLIMALLYQINKGKPLPLPMLIASAFLAGAMLSLKTAMGYEYTSTIMVSAVTPATFYALLNRWSLKSWLAQCFVIGLFLLGGFGLTMYLHYEALLAIGQDPLNVLYGSFAMRAHGSGVTHHNNMIAESIDAGLLETYARQFFHPQGVGLPQVVKMLPLFGWLWIKRKTLKQISREQAALLVCIALGAFGALSMYTILKGHAFIHGYDVVAWSIPMNIFLCVFYAREIQASFQKRQIIFA